MQFFPFLGSCTSHSHFSPFLPFVKNLHFFAALIRCCLFLLYHVFRWYFHDSCGIWPDSSRLLPQCDGNFAADQGEQVWNLSNHLRCRVGLLVCLARPASILSQTAHRAQSLYGVIFLFSLIKISHLHIQCVYFWSRNHSLMSKLLMLTNEFNRWGD